MAVRDLIVLNTTQSRVEPHQGSDTARLKGGSTELLRLTDASDVAVMTVRSLSPGLNISGSVTGSSISGSESSTGSFYYVEVDQMSGNANQIKDIIVADAVSSSAQLREAISGSWQGEFSSSAKLFLSGGISGSEDSTGSFSLVKSTTLIGSGQYLTNWLGDGTISSSLRTNLTSGSITHNRSMQFNGVDNYVDCGDAEILDLKRGSVSCWFKPAAINQQSVLVSRDDGSNRNWWIYLNNDETVYWTTVVGGTARNAISSTTYAAGTWMHVVGTHDGSNMKIYINGILENVTAASGDLDNDDVSFTIGAREAGADRHFNGAIDEVAVWTGSLSADSVYALYNNGNPTDLRQPWGIVSASQDVQYAESGSLLAWWRMGDSHHWSGSTVDGASPSGYITASFQGSRWFIDNVVSSSYATGSSANMSVYSASTDVPKNHSESGLDFYSQTVSNDVTGSWKNILDYSGSVVGKMRDQRASIGGISGSGTQAGNLQINTILSGSEASTGSFDKVHIDHLVGDGTLLTGIMPVGVISSSVRTNLTSSGKNYSFSGSEGVNSRHSPRFDVAHNNAQAGQGQEDRNFTISYWDYPWGFKHNKAIIRKESAYTLEQYISANTFHNRYEFRVGVNNTTYALSGSYSGSYWHHICLVREGSNAKLYMQGELAQTIPVGTGDLDDDTNPLTLMSSHNGSYNSPSAFGGFAMWDQGLSGSEVYSIYNQGEPTDLNHPWEDYSQTGSLILWLNPASSSFDSSDTNGVSPDGTWTIADSSVRNNMFGTSSGMNESSRSDDAPTGFIVGTQNAAFKSDISGSFTGVFSGSSQFQTSARLSGSHISTGSFDSLDVDFLEGDGSELTGIQPDYVISSSVGISGISGSWLTTLSGSRLLVVSSSFSGSAASTGSFDVLKADILRGDASEVTGLNVPSGTLSSSLQLADAGATALSSLASGSWSGVSSSLATIFVGSASGDQSVKSGSNPTFREVNITDTLFYKEIIVSSSDSSYSSSFASGSTAFGDDSSDTHEVTGSIDIDRLSSLKSFRYNGQGWHYANSPGNADVFTMEGNHPAMGSGFTLAAWVKIKSVPRTAGIIDRKAGNQGTSHTGMSAGGMYIYTNGSLYADIYDTGYRTIGDTTTKLNDNEWHFITYTAQANHSQSLYVDGELIAAGAIAAFGFGPGFTSVGAWTNNDSSKGALDGQIAEAMCWSDSTKGYGTLSGSAIKELYGNGQVQNPLKNRGTYQQSSSLWGWWRFGDTFSTPESGETSASFVGGSHRIQNVASGGYNDLVGSGSGFSNETYATRSIADGGTLYEVNPSDGPTTNAVSVLGNISGSSESSASFGTFVGSGDGLGGLIYTASRIDQTVWKGESAGFNIPTGSTADRTLITGSVDSRETIKQHVSASGMMRFNSTTNNFEGWDGRNWITLVEGSANSNTTVVSGSITISGSIPGQRGLFFGGYKKGLGSSSDVIEYVTISSQGDSIEFGNTQETMQDGTGVGSIQNIGFIHEGDSTDTLSYLPIDTPGDATDFGNLAQTGVYGAGTLMNGSHNRAVVAGLKAPGYEDMNYVNVRVPGNALDFGDLTDGKTARPTAGSNGLNQRGIFAGGATASPIGPAATDSIDYITISTLGNATTFGSLQETTYRQGGTTNDLNDRMVIFGSTDEHSADYLTISTPSNAIDFGKCANKGFEQTGACSNGVNERGVVAGGNPGQNNQIDYITISTLGDSKHFGDVITWMGYSRMGGLSNGAQ